MGLRSLGPLSTLSPRFLTGAAADRELYAKPMVGEAILAIDAGCTGPFAVFVTLGLREALADGGYDGEGGGGVAEGADPFRGAVDFIPIPSPTVPVDLLLVLIRPGPAVRLL